MFDCELTSDENITLDKVVLRLEELALEINIKKLQWPLEDKIISSIDIEKFKRICNKCLKEITIALVWRPPVIKDIVERQKLIEQFHNEPIYGGHCGQKQLYANLRNKYYWPKMVTDVAKFVNKCHVCKLSKPGNKTKEEMCITSTPQKPFDIVQIDTVGPLNKTVIHGYQFIVTIVCDLTKYLIAIPTTNKDAVTVAKAIVENFILIYGPMKGIRTDLGGEYVNEVFTEICKILKMKHDKSTAYHHLGTVERNQRLLNEYLRSYLNGKMGEWDLHLMYFTFCYNTTKSTTNECKYSPFELVYGHSSNLPYELCSGNVKPLYNIDNYAHEMRLILQVAHEEARKIIDKIKMRNKQYYDRILNKVEFKIGDSVKVANEPYKKFQNIYSGPFTVLEVDKENVSIDLNGKRYKIHKNRIILNMFTSKYIAKTKKIIKD